MIPEYSSPRGRGKKPMPVWARLVAGGIGLLMLAAGAGALAVVRPLSTQIAVGAVAAVVIGLDLIGGASSGKWPLALQWMPFV
jgi:hypothetical protein